MEDLINSIASTVTGDKSVPQCQKFCVQARNVLTNLSPNSARLVTLRCGYHAEDGQWCDCDVKMFMVRLWRRCCLMLQNLNVSGVNYAKLPEIEYKSPVYSKSSVLCNNIFVRIWIFFSISFKLKSIWTVWILWTIFAWLWVIVYQSMSA